jgi:hypothetical protein
MCREVVGSEVYLEFKLEAVGKWMAFGLGEPSSGSMPGNYLFYLF